MVKRVIIGVIVIIAIAGLVMTYTNTYDVLKPEVESSITTAKDAISKVNGSEVVEKAEIVSNKIKNVTDKIEVTNPLGPKQ